MSQFNPSILTSQEVINTLFKNVETGINRKLEKVDKQHIYEFVSKLNKVNFGTNSMEKVLKSLTKTFVTKFNTYQNKETKIDIQEMLKAQMAKDMGKDNVDASGVIVKSSDTESIISSFKSNTSGDNHSSNIKIAYILLDTRYRSLENDGTQYIRWNIASNNQRTDGSVSFPPNFGNIISIRIPNLDFPVQSNFTTSPYNNVTIFIRELNAQSYIANEGRNYHFMFDQSIKNNYVYLKCPDQYHKDYKFSTPITSLSSITIDFGSPLTPILLDKDRLQPTIWENSAFISPTTNTTGLFHTGTVFTFNENHNLNDGDYVYITGFNLNNPNLFSNSQIIRDINSPIGFPIIKNNTLTTWRPLTMNLNTSFGIYYDTTDTITLLLGSTAPSGFPRYLSGNYSFKSNVLILTNIPMEYTSLLTIGSRITFIIEQLGTTFGTVRNNIYTANIIYIQTVKAAAISIFIYLDTYLNDYSKIQYPKIAAHTQSLSDLMNTGLSSYNISIGVDNRLPPATFNQGIINMNESNISFSLMYPDLTVNLGAMPAIVTNIYPLGYGDLIIYDIVGSYAIGDIIILIDNNTTVFAFPNLSVFETTLLSKQISSRYIVKSINTNSLNVSYIPPTSLMYYNTDNILTDTFIITNGIKTIVDSTNYTILKYNTIPNNVITAYFASKRLFIPLQLTYKETTN